MSENKKNSNESSNMQIDDLAAPPKGLTVKIAKLSGQLDESNIDANSKTVYELISKYPENLFLLFDLSNLEYMNSKAIGYLTDWYSKIQEGGGKVVIAGAPKNVFEILQAIGITEIVPCFDKIEDGKTELLK